MAAITSTYHSGYQGSFEIDNVALPARSWQGRHSVTTADVTNLTSSGAQELVRGVESLNGSAVCSWKATSGAPAFVLGSIYATELITNGTQKYTFNALITEIAPSLDVKGDITYTVSFSSTGAITVAS